MIIKNFLGELHTGTGQFFISWDYISFPDGTEVGPQKFAIPSNLIESEFILRWNNGPVYDTALNTSSGAIAWYVSTYFLEFYFTDSKAIWDLNSLENNLPAVYNQAKEVAYTPGINFRSYEKNYPGQSISTGTLIPEYPGLIPDSKPIIQESNPIAKSLLSSFIKNIEINESVARTAWDTYFGPNTGTEFSASMLGLTRDDYSFISYIPTLLKSIVNKIVSNSVAYDTVFLTKIGTAKVISKNSIEDFKYSLDVTVPADLSLAVIEPGFRPNVIYSADGAEGSTISNSYGLNITLTPERYEPLIKLESIIAPTEFVRGYKYDYLTGQTLPSGFITTGTNMGRYPSLAGVRDTSPDIRLFEGKGTNAIIQFLFNLFKLRKGAAYDLTTDSITTGPEDFSPLTLWSLPPLTTEFLPESIVGSEDNAVTVWLPFSYKRDAFEWRLTHEICAAFLNNYTIGYHEFTADYSAAGEPVNTIEGFINLPVYLDICEIFTARESPGTFINLAPQNIDENTINAELTLTSDNVFGVFSLVSGAGSVDNNSFTIVGNKLRFNGSPNYEVKSSYSVRIRAGVDPLEAVFVIAINDLNEGPQNLIVDGLPIVTPIGPTFGNSNYTITNNSSIIQDAQGRIAVSGGFGGGSGGGFGGGFPGGGYGAMVGFIDTNTNEQFFTILLLENNPAPTLVANLSNDDPDQGVISTYTLASGVGDADNGSFSITNNQLFVNITTDYEIKKEYFIRIRVTTDGGLFVELPVRVNIVQRPEYPNDINLSSSLIGDFGQVIGTLSTVDPDSGSSFTYSIVGGGLQSYLSISNSNNLILASNLDGAQSNYSVIIRATDETGLYIEKLFTLTFQTSVIEYIPLAIGVPSNYYSDTIGSTSGLIITNTKSEAIASPYNNFLINTYPSTITSSIYNYFIVQN